MSSLDIQVQGGVGRVLLNRPERHNAFNAQVIEELLQAFERLGRDPGARVVLLHGAGPSFSAGADLEWMREMGQATTEDNRASARRMAGLFETIDRCPKPVVAKVHGAALGGGCGLVCAVDLAVAGPKAVFGFTEIRVGILPAVISPFAIRRLGESQARARFLTGSRFSAEVALRIGMVHALADDLDAEVERTLDALLQGAPQAQAQCKDLVRQVTALPRDAQLDYTLEQATASRAAAEGREGMSAFLEKRKAAWSPRVES